MAKTTKPARKPSAVLKKATKPSAKEAITDIKQNIVHLRLHLKGFKMDHREARAIAASANKAYTATQRVIIKQINLIDKANAQIEKLKAA